VSFLAWSLPAAVLLAAAFGAPLSSSDLVLAGVAAASMLATRAGIAVFLDYPLWPALTHPCMAAVWVGIMARSFTWRFFKREMRWRGRTYPAATARF
jgi:hypothetical protein